MPNYTTNYGLEKPIGSPEGSAEFYDVEVQNNNMDAIDAQLKANADAAAAAIAKAIITAANDFIVGQSSGVPVKKTLAETKSILGINNVQNYGIASQAEAEAGTASNKYMTPERVAQAIAIQFAALIGSAPSTLDTLDELAQALGDDPNFATTITTLIGTKQAYNANNAMVKMGTGTYTDNDSSQTFTDAFCTANSTVIVSVTSGSPAGDWTVVPGAGSFTINSSQPESADIGFAYTILKVVG
jgi:hypothetical protein